MYELKEYVVKLLEKDSRMDGRKPNEYRKIEIERGVSSKSAEGSARVKIGKTEVVAGVKLDKGAPYPDTPDEGSLMVNVELLPLASPDFEAGPPGREAIELSRVVDRGIRESKCIDTKKLCIKKGEIIWMVFVDIYPINDAGNMFDACALAAIEALKDAKLPKYDKKEGKVIYEERTKEGLPLKEMPASCTVCKIGEKFLIDPNDREEKAIDARLTVACLKDGTVTALQKGGESALTIEDVDEMVKMAVEKSKELRK